MGTSDALDRVWEGGAQGGAGALVSQPLSIAVELIGLNDEEIDALASLTDELSSLVPDNDVNRVREPHEVSTYSAAP